MTYTEFIEKITPYAESEFAVFQRRLIQTKYKILGIRTPILRKLAKEARDRVEELLSYPDEYYEVVFIKLTVVSSLPYGEFIQYLDSCVSLMDNWALCDCFKAKCLKKHRREFLSVLDGVFEQGGEYFQRYVLVTFLSEYMEEEYLPTITLYITKADTSLYYVHMAVAWLVAEILVKHYDYGVHLIQSKNIDPKTHNKAIQKAIESYRITQEQKEYLRSLKIK